MCIWHARQTIQALQVVVQDVKMMFHVVGVPLLPCFQIAKKLLAYLGLELQISL